MRRSADEKARSRDRILDVAATRIRESGLEGPSVAGVMREAGMTHGGFYKHFESRGDLVRAAVERAVAANKITIRDLLAGSDDPWGAFVDEYLSTEHVADPGHGCTVAALAGEIAHADDAVRTMYRRQVEDYLDLLERLLGTREAARTALSTLVGAVTMARALGDPVLGEPVLRDARTALRSQARGDVVTGSPGSGA